MKPRSAQVDHVIDKFTPNPFWMQDSSVLEHVYAYMMDGIDGKERTVFQAWFIATCKGIFPSENVHVTFDKVKHSFDRLNADDQAKALKRVDRYVASYTERPDSHSQILERLMEVQDYFKANLKSAPTTGLTK